MLSHWDQKLVHLVSVLNDKTVPCTQPMISICWILKKKMLKCACHSWARDSKTKTVNLTGCLGHMPRWSTAAGLQSGKKPKEITTLSLSTLSLSTFQDWHPGEQELLYGTLRTMVTINKPPPPHTSHQELRRQESYLLAIRGSYLSITDFLWQPEKTGEELSETIMRSEGLGDAVASLPVCHPLLHRCPSTPSKPWAVQMLDSPQDG